MKAAEYELRSELDPLEKKEMIRVYEHDGWLTTTERF